MQARLGKRGAPAEPCARAAGARTSPVTLSITCYGDVQMLGLKWHLWLMTVYHVLGHRTHLWRSECLGSPTGSYL